MDHTAGRNRDGKRFLSFSLEPGSVEMLKQGTPIKMRAEDYFPGTIVPCLEVCISLSETPSRHARKFGEVPAALRVAI